MMANKWGMRIVVGGAVVAALALYFGKALASSEKTEDIVPFSRAVPDNLDDVPPLSCDFSQVEQRRWFGARPGRFDWHTITLVDPQSGAGKTLRFPYPYMDTPLERNGARTSAISFQLDKRTYLRLDWVDEQSKEFKARYHNGIRDTLNILLKYQPGFDYEKGVRALIRSRYKVPAARPFDLTSVATKEANGLYRMNGKMVGTDQPLRFSLNQGKITDEITCSEWGKRPAPYCSYWFQLGDYTVSSGFPLQELDDWKTHREGIARLIACFEKEN